MKLKALVPLFAIPLLALSLSACSKAPAPAPEPPPAPEPTASAPAAPKVMTFEEAALFEFDKAELKPEGQEQLKAYREQAIADLSSAEKVRVVGYTDNTGTAEHNATLSQRRAEVVRDYLVSIGVDPAKLEAIGAADANPIADNSTTEGQARNRRVEIEVTGMGK